MMPDNIFEEVQRLLARQLRLDPAQVQMESQIKKDRWLYGLV